MKFKILKKSIKYARVGEIETSHGTIKTPTFIVGGTKATVKALTIDQINQIGGQAILANTYHLMLQPGAEIIEKAGGLANFMSYDKPTLTDSGGFQIFSLGLAYKKNLTDLTSSQSTQTISRLTKGLIKINDQGVEFKSHLDGTKYYMSPEISMTLQHQIGADIHMAFDQLTTPLASEKIIEEACQRTHQWAERCLIEHQKLNLIHKKKKEYTQSLYGIVQGGRVERLRVLSSLFLADKNFDGYGIGGIFEPQEIDQVLNWVIPNLPERKPRHLLGMGAQPLDLFLGIENGIDTFDCVAPTRQARNGALYTKNGRINIKNSIYKTNFQAIDQDCQCYTCLNHNLAYLHHLFKANELLAYTLSSIHNEFFIIHLVDQIRSSMLEENYITFKDQFLKSYYQDKLDFVSRYLDN